MLIKSIPRSNAQTVYDLLQDVKQAILEEPKRVHMGFFCIFGDHLQSRLQQKGPSCGTVGCFAGWVNLLAGRSRTQIDTMSGASQAQQILGTDLNYELPRDAHRYAYETFNVFDFGFGDGISGIKYGTRAYARAVVRRINRFIAANGGKTALQKRMIARVS